MECIKSLLDIFNIKQKLKDSANNTLRGEAMSCVKPVCYIDEETGELRNYISVFGMRVFDISEDEGYFSVKSKDAKMVVDQLRDEYIKMRRDR